MQVFVYNTAGKTIVLDVEPFDPIKKVKDQIKDREGLSIEAQRLIFHGKMLCNENTLDDYDVKDKDTIHLVLRLEGGTRNYGKIVKDCIFRD